MEELPDEILRELFRLFDSYADLFRTCGLICKKWTRLIRQPLLVSQMINRQFRDTACYLRGGWQYYLPIHNNPNYEYYYSKLSGFARKFMTQCDVFFKRRDAILVLKKLGKYTTNNTFFFILALLLCESLPTHKIVLLTFWDPNEVMDDITIYSRSGSFPKSLIVPNYDTLNEDWEWGDSKYIFLVTDQDLLPVIESTWKKKGRGGGKLIFQS